MLDAAPTQNELVFLTAAEATRLFLARKLSPVELVDAFLARIDKVDAKVKSYILVDGDRARAKARVAEAEIMAGRWRGALHGIPYGAKDNFFTKGVRTCANSKALMDHVPEFDAAIVETLDEAGAIMLGKLNTWEYGTGQGLVYHDVAYAHARNPWKDDYCTGGSSTGSGASVAAGTAMFALGADTGGSIRSPAAGCGLQGLKPTYGLVSRHGILPNCWSLDTPGPMTWSIEDNANVLQAIAGFDARDSATVDRPVPDYVRDIGEAIAIEQAVTEGLEDVVAELKLQGATVVDVSLPLPPSRYRELTTLISGTERATVHEKDFVEKGHLMGRELREALMMGTAARGVDYVTAQRRRRELADSMDALVSRFDAILLPCAYRTATPFSDPDLVKDFQGRSATTAFNISGHPALAMRTGFDGEGLPTSAQLVGRYFDEAMVLRIARAYERARDWHTRRPDL